MMSKRLEGKIALVTGAGNGIGEATARRLSEEGALVVATDIDEASAQQVVADICASGGRAEARLQDVTDEALWDIVVQEIVSAHGALHVLVNNAGVGIPGSVEDATLEQWRTTQTINGESVFFGTRAAISVMKKSGGSIINISSIEGIVGEPNAAAYNYSKGGVRIFTKSAALHCGKQGYPIRVNSVHPGYIRTAIIDKALAEMPEEAGREWMDRVGREIPLGGEMGESLDIANGCLFLASDESKYMTGSELIIDGGYTCH